MQLMQQFHFIHLYINSSFSTKEVDIAVKVVTSERLLVYTSENMQYTTGIAQISFTEVRAEKCAPFSQR